MSKARNLADLLDSNGDVSLSNLDNVPAADLVNDTTPQLGGNLDLNSNNITGTGNIDVTGTVTADSFSSGDGEYAYFGASQDLKIGHDGSNSIVADMGTGSLILQDSVGNPMGKFTSGGKSELYFDGNKKLETLTGGVTITGTCTATAFSGDGSGLSGTGASTTYNAVGTYILGYNYSTSDMSGGSTTTQVYGVSASSSFSSSVSGTWRCMGKALGNNGSNHSVTVFVRIS